MGETGEEYYVTFPASFAIVGLPASNYWIRAFIDEDSNGQFTLQEEGGQYAVDPIAVSNRVTGLDLTLVLDTDEDGLLDWWEMEHFGGATGDGTGANDDPDGDGITNMREYALGTNPNVENPTVTLTSSDVTVEYKSREAERNKFQHFPSFITATPPLYYLKLVRDDESFTQDYEPDCTQLYIWDGKYDLTLTADPSTMEIWGQGTGRITLDMKISNVVHEIEV